MIGLLNAYHFEDDPQSYQLKYGPMFAGFLKSALPAEKIKIYGVGRGEFPATAGECEGWIITGSPKSAYESDPWIQKLGAFVQQIDREKKKLVGVCFGHQLTAHYLGGRTEKSKNGWGVGVRKFNILNSKTWMKPELNECSLIFSHQDQVVSLPKGGDLLASDPFCPNQMYSVAEHIFCFQGHPEFTPEFAKDRLDSRVNLIGKPVYEEAVGSLKKKTNSEEVGTWMRNFFAASP